MNTEASQGPLTKEMYYNPLINRVLASTIQEWDIQAAHLQALKIIFGQEDSRVLKLSQMDKQQRNITIGKMMINNKEFVQKIQELLFTFKGEFIKQNNIRPLNIVETTKDSIILTNKFPTKTTINVSGVDIKFVDKDGIYSSYIRFKGGRSIFFDSITRRFRFKGINKKIVDESTFVKKCIIPTLVTLENSVSMGQAQALKNLRTHRLNYINNDDLSIYRQLDYNNHYLYMINNEIMESEGLMSKDDSNLIKTPNYIDYLMPLMQSIL